jgi:hypothetical protein
VPEIRVTCDEWGRLIEAALRDERVSDPNLPLLLEHGSAQHAGALPETRFEVEDRQPAQQGSNRARERRITEQLRQHHRRQRQLLMIERRLDGLDIIPVSYQLSCWH